MSLKSVMNTCIVAFKVIFCLINEVKVISYNLYARYVPIQKKRCVVDNNHQKSKFMNLKSFTTEQNTNQTHHSKKYDM